MTRDIVDIQDFTILLEQAVSEQPTLDACAFEEPSIGVAFYGSGDVEVSIEYGDKVRKYAHTRGLALSFYADENVSFIHQVSPDKPLNCIVIVTAIRKLKELPNQEGEIFHQFLKQLVQPTDHYIQGPRFIMNPDMQQLTTKIFSTSYQGKAEMMLFRSRITALLAQFFGELSTLKEEVPQLEEREKLFQAKEILTSDLSNPPSLNELSRKIGLNDFKLKKEFKELFGLPVFKYLQQERLSKAHELLRKQQLSIQEAAWEVGYDSISSFSNAFNQKFGYRPSTLKK